MDDSFHTKVNAAAVAAWWTLGIAAAVLTLQWLVYLGFAAGRVAWVLPLWGPGETWESVRPVWFRVLLILKLSLWPLVLAATWLTLWARQLRKATRSA